MSIEENLQEQKIRLLTLEIEELKHQYKELKADKKEEKKGKSKNKRQYTTEQWKDFENTGYLPRLGKRSISDKTIPVYSMLRTDGKEFIIPKTPGEEYLEKIDKDMEEFSKHLEMSDEENNRIMQEMLKFQEECDKQEQFQS